MRHELRFKSPPAGRYVQRIRISFLENPFFSPSLQGETMGRESLRKGPKRVALGARPWDSPALWPPPGSGATKTPASRAAALTGGPVSRAIRGTRLAPGRPSSTSCSAAALPSRALPHLCARTVGKRSGGPSVARAASASPAARWMGRSGGLTSVARSMRGGLSPRGVAHARCLAPRV